MLPWPLLFIAALDAAATLAAILAATLVLSSAVSQLLAAQNLSAVSRLAALAADKSRIGNHRENK